MKRLHDRIFFSQFSFSKILIILPDSIILFKAVYVFHAVTLSIKNPIVQNSERKCRVYVPAKFYYGTICLDVILFAEAFQKGQ
jgi:hypothetical protein